MRRLNRTISKIRKANQRANRKASSPGGRAAHRSTAAWFGSVRAAVRVSELYPRHLRSGWRAAGKYIGHNRPAQEGRWEVFGPEGPVAEPRELAGEWWEAGDGRVYKIVISPESGAHLDLQLLTLDVMGKVGYALTQEINTHTPHLEWMAAIHQDTDLPHVHVVLRARAAGLEFFLPPKLKRNGIRRIVQDAAARQLSHVRQPQISKEQVHERPTS